MSARKETAVISSSGCHFPPTPEGRAAAADRAKLSTTVQQLQHPPGQQLEPAAAITPSSTSRQLFTPSTGAGLIQGPSAEDQLRANQIIQDTINKREMIAAAAAAAARELNELEDLAKSYGVDFPAATNKPAVAQLTQTSTSAAREPAQLIPQETAAEPPAAASCCAGACAPHPPSSSSCTDPPNPPIASIHHAD